MKSTQYIVIVSGIGFKEVLNGSIYGKQEQKIQPKMASVVILVVFIEINNHNCMYAHKLSNRPSTTERKIR